MLTKEIAIATAKEFIATCEKNNIFFTNAILFGSTVNGTVTETSDIDLLLVSEQFGYNSWENARLIAKYNKKFSIIETHNFPKDYFLQGNDPFIKEVKQTGLALA
jgi:predicted nucleotidyltransferase